MMDRITPFFVFSALLMSCNSNQNHVTDITTMKTIIFTENAPAPIGPYAQAVLINGQLFVSGQIAIDPKTGALDTADIRTECTRVMENLRAVLNKADMDFENVLKTTIFLSDMGHFAVVNEVYASYIGDNPPARETIAVKALPKNVNIEISCIAAK